jgi:nicotinate-nucleotide--dimethylbenzimidazole phosphoribosyltransferase
VTASSISDADGAITEAAGAFADAAAAVRPLDEVAARAAAERHDRLTKPRGSLGRLEALGIHLAAIAGEVPPPVPAPAAVAVFAADHGVVAEGVTPWPKEVTAQMVANFVAGGAAISVLARRFDARVLVVDVGVDADLAPAPGLRLAKVRRGSANLAREPAMTLDEVDRCLDVGAAVAAELTAAGAACIVTGEMGIGNTTASAALIGALTGNGAAAVTGRGTGVDDSTLARKVAVVERALSRVAAAGIDASDPRALLAELGGLEIAALAGFVVGGVAARLPVVGDGVIALAAIAVAEAIVPGVRASCIAGHRSTEPAAALALRHLDLEPVLDLGMRLGEGTGACLALPVLEAAARVLAEMATFDEAGVVDKDA